MRFGLLEAGGTKMECAIGDETGAILSRSTIPTRSPGETLEAICDYFLLQNKTAPIDSFGIASFGPIDLRPSSPTYGCILESTKLEWRHVSMIAKLEETFGVPIGLDTDVNGSCLGEATFGSSKGLTDVAYITVGTGIGAGIMVGGKLVHGNLHPEFGHIQLTCLPGDEGNGCCHYHGNCLEGLASGPSIEKRWGIKASEIPETRSEVWETEAEYLAQAVVNLIVTVAPQKIILGGGVMHKLVLFDLVRKKVIEKLAGYLVTDELANIEDYIIPASLGDDQGLLGALRLAQLALH